MSADAVVGAQPVDDPLLATPAEEPGALPDAGVPGGLVVLGTGLALFLAQWASTHLWVPPTRLTTVWIQGGLLLGITLMVPKRRWPLVLAAGALGQALLFIVLGLVSVSSALLVCAVNALVNWVLAMTFRRVLPQGFPLATVREFMIYFLVIAVGGAFLAATIFLLSAIWAGFREPTFAFWRTFALASVLAYVTVTPAVVHLVQQFSRSWRNLTGRLVEATALAMMLGFSSSLVFTGEVSPSVAWPAFGITVPPLLLWAATRFGTFGVSVSLLFVTTISTLGTGRGLGPFAGQSPDANTMTLQFFLLATGIPFLALSIALAGQRRDAAALKSTHTRLRALNRDLVQAREEESTRIARELHDGIGQHLALVSIGLGRLRGTIADSGSGPVQEVSMLQAHTSSIVRSLRELSHRLHPSTLDHAGLALTLQMTCEEVAQGTRLPVTYQCDGDTALLSREVALCLFRVAQEALTNAVRHSGSPAIAVRLSVTDDGVELLVSDQGRGFITQGRRTRAGLGLHSSNERVAAVGGSMAVTSIPGSGTAVRVLIPLKRDSDA